MDSDNINKIAYLQRIVPAVMEWFSVHGRSLPWRDEPLPYYVWVSEVMLQQTRIETVKPYYRRFLKELPGVKDLAECPEEKLMKLWEGLGYYSRARNMQKAARLIMEKYGGNIPEEASVLKTLPGIGNYTAAAVSSIAYGCCEAAVDGNVLRVVSRICADDSCIDEPRVRKDWESVLQQVMEKFFSKSPYSAAEKESGPSSFSPGIFNQAMMEIGEVVCVPNGEPACGSCPVSSFCFSCREGRVLEYPVRKKKGERRHEKKTVLVISDGESAVLHKRDSKGLLAGLYELPNYAGRLSGEEVLSKVRDMGLEPVRIVSLPAAKHVFSHVEWEMTGFFIRVNPAEDRIDEKNHDQKLPDTGECGEEKGSAADDLILRDGSGGKYLLTGTGNVREKYAVPSAFSAYMKYLKMG